MFQQGIYVLIDWHYIGNGNYSNGNAYQAFTNRAVAFFTAMSQRYRAVPNVLYEIWNEPTDTPWETIKTYHNAVIAVSFSREKAYIEYYLFNFIYYIF
jgi:endoglucanase